VPDYNQGAEVDYVANLRKEASSSSDIVTQLAQGDQLIIDVVAIDSDDPECASWYAAQYQPSSDVTLEGYICANLVHLT
jgi:hypothetical protein